MPNPTKPSQPLTADAVRAEFRKMREITEMLAARVTALEQARAEAPRPAPPDVHAGLTREGSPRPDAVQRQILDELRKGNKRHESSVGGVLKIFAFIIVVIIAAVFIWGGLKDMGRTARFNASYMGSPPGPSQHP